MTLNNLIYAAVCLAAGIWGIYLIVRLHRSYTAQQQLGRQAKRVGASHGWSYVAPKAKLIAPHAYQTVWATDWVEQHATPLDAPPSTWAEVPAGHTIICIVQNSGFDACAVAFGETALVLFTTDPRPRRWFQIKTTELLGNIQDEDMFRLAFNLD